MREIHKIALTGGPSGGKSTLQRRIVKEAPEALAMPEAATILLSGGYPAPTEQYPWTQRWQDGFQQAVIATQLSLDDMGYEKAFREHKYAVVYDRGLPDAAAYLTGGMAELEEITGLSEKQMLGRYALVLHMPSSAVGGNYDKASNPHRFEEAEVALALEQRTLEVWKNHPNRVIVQGDNKDEKLDNAMAVIREYV